MTTANMTGHRPVRRLRMRPSCLSLLAFFSYHCCIFASSSAAAAFSFSSSSSFSFSFVGAARTTSPPPSGFAATAPSTTTTTTTTTKAFRPRACTGVGVLSSAAAAVDDDAANKNVVDDDDDDDERNYYDLSLFSPCKINLFLRILRKRPDGYHDLASLFQTVGFGDRLYLKRLPSQSSSSSSSSSSSDDDDENDDDLRGDRFYCNMDGVPTDRTNLVLRALDLVREKTDNVDVKFEARLVKKVPAQAGLGGGSGNAAAAMYGANELLGRPATHEQLVDWSGELGSDITFFLSHGTAYCTGRGEIMTPVRAPFDFTEGGTKLCIVKPDVGLSTPQVFGALRYDELSDVDPKELLSRFLEFGIDAGGGGDDDDAYVNDLEQPAFDCLPELRRLKEELSNVDGFEHVMMSGSGTSIFCIGTPIDADKFMDEFGKRDGLNVFFTEFITREEGEGMWFQERGKEE